MKKEVSDEHPVRRRPLSESLSTLTDKKVSHRLPIQRRGPAVGIVFELNEEAGV